MKSVRCPWIVPIVLLISGSFQAFGQAHGEHDDHLHSLIDGDYPVCGTHLMWQLQVNEEKLDDKGRELLRQYRVTDQPTMQRNIVSYDGHFRIHYDIDGKHAPSPVDQDSNGIPDYIDSVDFYMELAWKKEIEECGFAPPPPDNIRPGVGGIDGLVDVFVQALSNSIYGFALPEPGGEIGSRSVGYLILDNDYVGYPTPGIAGLRVTSAHEFHHIVQFGAYINDYSQGAIFEATSTWMEFKVHPDLTDYRLYFNRFLKQPHAFSFATNDVSDGITGYAHMHYLQSLVQQLDPKIVREIWNQFKSSGKAFDAIDATLRARNAGINLTNSFCTFARWSYFTGSNAVDTMFFAKADLYPTIRSVSTLILDEDLEKVIPNSLSPLSFGLWRLVVPRSDQFDPDTVDFLITNARSMLGTGGPSVSRPEDFTLFVSQSPRGGYTPILYRNDTLYYRLDAPHQDFCVETFFNGSRGILVTVNPLPQPFVNDGADQMVFAVDLSGIAITRVELDIYSASMTKVARVERNGLETRENVQGVIWDGRTSSGEFAPSGVYIFTLAINGSAPSVGKFAVVRK